MDGDEAFLNEKGIRILKLGATFPVDSNIIKQFTENLNEVFVIEEKRSFIEMLIKEEVYNYANKPLIIGKTDEHNNPLIPGYGELTADDLSKIIFNRYASRLGVESDNNKINIISEVDNRVYGRVFELQDQCIFVLDVLIIPQLLNCLREIQPLEELGVI